MPHLRAVWGALASAALVIAGCGAPDAEPAALITATVLIEADASAPRWHRDVAVPKGTDGYELLEAAVEGDLEADWFPEFRAHFVEAIGGIAPEGAEFWGVFLWNESSAGWEPLPVGADLFSVKDGHIMAWALVEFDPGQPQLPVNSP